jgi:hypothetical protein
MSANIPNNPVAIQRFFTSRDNNANAETYVGQEQRLWYNPITNGIYVSDGNTAGGILVGTSSSGNGAPGGPTNSIQYNAGSGTFGGTANITISGNGMAVIGNVTSAYFIGDGSQLTNLPIQAGTYSNANVASYLPTYSGNILANNISTGNILTNNYLYANGNSIFANTTITGNINLGNLYINDQTIGGKNINGNIAISPEGSGYVLVPKLAIPIGSLIEATAPVAPIVASLVLTQIVSYSTGDSLPPGSYGNPNAVAAPWAVYEFTTDPTPPLLATLDTLGGLGVPGNSVVQWSGTGSGNTNIVVASQTYDGLITPIPPAGTVITVAQLVTRASLEIGTKANTDVRFTPGAGGTIIAGADIVPADNNTFALGTPATRFNQLWMGQGNINLLDQYLDINQTIYAYNGNLIIGAGTGLKFGLFEIYDSTISTTDANANIILGKITSNAYVQINRPIAVRSTGGLNTAFEVDRTGITTVKVPGNISNTQSAFNIVGSSSGNIQPRPATFTGTLLQMTGQDNQAARISIDAFGANGAQNSYALIAARVARGNVDTPAPLQVNDLMMRLTNQGWTGNGYAPSIARFNFAAAENFTSNAAVGTYANIQLTPIGSNVIKTVVGFNANGVVFANSASGGTGNLGITFQDGTYQNTAFSNTQVVTNATAATGITVTPAATGNITITNTGVITVGGTSNQVFVNGANNVAQANGIISLSLPQDIAPSSSPTFNVLTVNDLTILGNVSNVIPSVVSGPIVYVANTATQLSDINTSGLISGNAANGYYAGMLYNTTSNTWDMSIGNSVGITADFVDAGNANVEVQLHVGNAVAHLDYPYAVIQGDMDQDTYTQIVFQNHNQGANASTDYVAVNDIGNDGNNYIDMGINSSVYNNADYVVTKPNDGYLYVNGGNLVIGTQTAGNIITFFTGGTNSTSYIRGTVNNTGLSMVGNVTANNIIGNTVFTTNLNATANVVTNNLLANTQVSAAGAVTGQNIYTAGQVSATGTITGGNITAVAGGTISTTGNVRAGKLITATTTIDGGVSTSGNVIGNNYTGGTVSMAGNVTGSYLIATAQVNAPAISVSGTVTAGNITSLNAVSAGGNVIAGNINVPAGRVVVLGNVDAGNLRTANLVAAATVSATGNVYASYYNGNGAFLTGLNAFQTINANGTNLTASSTAGLVNMLAGNNIVITSNVANANIVTAVSDAPTFSGNVTGGNVLTGGVISATGNIRGANVSIVGNTTTANLSVSGISNLNSNANVKISGGSTGQLLSTDGTGNLLWISSGNIAPTSGTWTPTLVPETGSYTLTINNTYYQKIGGVAFCTFDITIASQSSPTGNVIMGNLPFTSASTAATTGSLAVSYYALMNSPTNVVSGAVPGSANTVTMYWQGSSDNSMNLLTGSKLKVNTRLIGSVNYATV